MNYFNVRGGYRAIVASITSKLFGLSKDREAPSSIVNGCYRLSIWRPSWQGAISRIARHYYIAETSLATPGQMCREKVDK